MFFNALIEEFFGGKMIGLNLRTFRLDLERLPSDSSNPLENINWEEKFEPHMERLQERYDPPLDYLRMYPNLPLDYFSNFSFTELCQLNYVSRISMHGSIGELFDKKVQYEIVRKIKSSIWRWGMGIGSWNEIVDAYDNIRRFKLICLPDFEVRLEYTTGYNERGYSKFSRLFIDGVFAFYIYHKGKHVFTLGFSILAGRKLLVQQVQSAQQKKNRSLYKLPQNRIEFAVDMFTKNFPGYQIYLVSGDALVNRIKKDYESALGHAESYLDSHRSETGSSYYESVKEDCKALQEKIAHLDGRRSQIAGLYSESGKYRLGNKVLRLNGLDFKPVMAGKRGSKAKANQMVMAY